jgi:hypothetical protein
MEHDGHGLGNQTVLPLSLNQAKLKDLDIDKPIGAAPQGHFFVGGGGGVWAKKFVTLRGLRIFEKKEILRKPTLDIVS